MLVFAYARKHGIAGSDARKIQFYRHVVGNDAEMMSCRKDKMFDPSSSIRFGGMRAQGWRGGVQSKLNCDTGHLSSIRTDPSVDRCQPLLSPVASRSAEVRLPYPQPAT